MKKVMVFGTFDGVHEGHRQLFVQAKEYGDYLIVIVARDKTVEAVKGRPSRRDEAERLAALLLEQNIDEVVMGNIEDKYQVIGEHRPEVIVLGYDQRNFIDRLEQILTAYDLADTRIVRAKPHKPEIYKSSKIDL